MSQSPQTSQASLQSLSAPDLADLLRREGERHRTRVLDVRDDDFADLGHIVGAVNIPCWDLIHSNETMDTFLFANLKRAETHRCIVHCWLSQQRGPTVAARIKQRLSQLDSPELIDPENVFVLQQGFRRFWGLYSNDSDLVVKY
jgi:rhodanese-related sulfurtransferase